MDEFATKINNFRFSKETHCINLYYGLQWQNSSCPSDIHHPNRSTIILRVALAFVYSKVKINVRNVNSSLLKSGCVRENPGMLENIKVREWMTTPVISVSPSTSISSAHQIMKKNSIRRLPVVDDEKLVGIVTIGDVREASPSDATTLSIWELNYLWAQLTVEKVMTRKVITVSPETEMVKAAELMLDNKVSGLPVIDEHSKLIGILTESDIFRMVVKARELPTT